MTQKEKYIFYSIFVFFLLFNPILIFQQNLLPFVDLPNHLAEATIYRHYWDPGNQFSRFFSIDKMIDPNTFNLYFFSLKLFPDVETAAKFFYSLYSLMLPFSILLLLKKSGGNVWFSLFSFLYVYNFNTTWGFSGFTIGIPVLMFSLYLLILKSEKGKLYIDILLIFASLLLFIMHALVAGLFVMIVMLSSILIIRKKKHNFLKNSYIAFPLIIIIIYWWITSDHDGSVSTSSYLKDYYSNTYLLKAYKRFAFVCYDDYHLFRGIWGIAAGTLFSSSILIPFFLWFVKNFKEFKNEMSDRKENVLWSFIFCSFFIIFFFPPDLPGQWYLCQRFGVFLLLGLIVINGKRIKAGTMLKVGAVISVIIYSFLWTNFFLDFAQENLGINSDFFKDVNNNVLAGIIYDQSFRSGTEYIHFPNYFIIKNKGIATTMMADYRFSIIKRKAGKDILPSYDAMMNSVNTAYLGYCGMKYILVRGEIPPENRDFFNRFKLYSKTGKWELWKKMNNGDY